MRVREFFSLLKSTIVQWSEDGAPRLGAALAYYTLFSISPLLLIVIAGAGFLFGEDAVRGQLIGTLQQLMGAELAKLLNGLISATARPTANKIASVIAIVVILFGATGFFAQLRDALDTIWGVRQVRASGILSTVWRYWWSLTMILGTGFLMMVSLLVSAALNAAGNFAFVHIANAAVLLKGLHITIDLGVSALLFAMIFKFIPNVELPWKIALRGGLFTSVLFLIGETVLGIYLGRAGVASTYGAAGAVMMFLLWTYYSAQILLFGAEFTKLLAASVHAEVLPSTGYVIKKAA